ncbi:hypothetical protein [Neobacillus vireti]|uniref:hypothetical protein n=1 Tax=Neobacillus vireti TaxID=220686 RepID=UPI003000A46F
MILVNKLWTSTKLFATVCLIWYLSGSLYYMFTNRNIQILEVFAALIAICIFLIKKSKFVIKQDTLYILIISFCALFNLLLISGVSFGLLFLSEVCIFVIAYVFSEKIPYESFVMYTINIICGLALISLVGWFFSETLVDHYLVRYTGNWDIRSFYVFNINAMFPERNSGAFWEPGMYQGYLNFAILLIILKTKRNKWDIFRIVLLALTVFTTFSTTGYLILAMLIMLYFRQHKNSMLRIFMSTVITIVLLFVSMNIGTIIQWIESVSLYSITSKITTGDVSFTTRIYAGFCDLIIALHNPLGADRNHLAEIVQLTAASIGKAVSARTNTFTTAFAYFGIVNGIFYISLWIKGCFKSGTNVIDKILITIIITIILSTEPHYDLLYFNIVLFYWLNLKSSKHLSNKFNVVQKSEV